MDYTPAFHEGMMWTDAAEAGRGRTLPGSGDGRGKVTQR
jgi:hypothetical protein